MRLLLLLLHFLQATKAVENELVQLTRDILSLTFGDPYCISCLGHGNALFEKALMSAGISLVRNDKHQFVSGYLIFIKNSDDLTNYQFLPHKRVLLVTPSLEQFDLERLKYNEVVVIEGYDSNSNIKLRVLYNKGDYKIWFNGTIQAHVVPKMFEQENGVSQESIRIGVFNFPPYLIVNSLKLNGIEKYILEIVAKNWSVEIVPFPASSWGRLRRDIKRGAIDLGMGAHAITSVLNDGLDVTCPYMQVTITYLVPKPHLLPVETFMFQPLGYKVWTSIGVVVLALAGIYYTIFKCILGVPKPYVFLTLDVLGTLVIDSREVLSRGSPLKPLFISLNFMAIIFQTNYSAGFTSNMAAPRYSPPVDTFRDMYEKGVHVSDNETLKFLENSHDFYKRAIANTRSSAKKQVHVADVIENCVILEEPNVSEEEKKRLKLLHESVGNFDFVFALAKNSHFTKIFSENIQMFVEHGLVEAWFRFTMYQNVSQLGDMSSFFSNYAGTVGKNRPLTLIRLQGIYYVLISGYISAFAVFMIEVFFEFPKIA